MLQLTQTGNRNNSGDAIPSKRNSATKFSMDDIVAGQVGYRHDDTETRNDSFRFSVFETTFAEKFPPEVVFNGWFSIDVELQNDNVPRRVNEAALDVVFGVGRRLGPEHLKYVDADMDTDRLDFTWEAEPETVELVLAEDRWTALYHFTQVDVNEGRVYVHHYSRPENVIVLWVCDANVKAHTERRN